MSSALALRPEPAAEAVAIKPTSPHLSLVTDLKPAPIVSGEDGPLTTVVRAFADDVLAEIKALEGSAQPEASAAIRIYRGILRQVAAIETLARERDALSAVPTTKSSLALRLPETSPAPKAKPGYCELRGKRHHP